jgi:hypothetical protein
MSCLCAFVVHDNVLDTMYIQCTFNVCTICIQCTLQCTLQMYPVMYIWWPMNCAFYALPDVTSNVVPTVYLRHIYCPFLYAFIVHCNVHYNVQLNVHFNSCDVCKMHIARTQCPAHNVHYALLLLYIAMYITMFN